MDKRKGVSCLDDPGPPSPRERVRGPDRVVVRGSSLGHVTNNPFNTSSIQSRTKVGKRDREVPYD